MHVQTHWTQSPTLTKVKFTRPYLQHSSIQKIFAHFCKKNCKPNYLIRGLDPTILSFWHWESRMKTLQLQSFARSTFIHNFFAWLLHLQQQNHWYGGHADDTDYTDDMSRRCVATPLVLLSPLFAALTFCRRAASKAPFGENLLLPDPWQSFSVTKHPPTLEESERQIQ